ncbi:MAG: SRPBCC family protein [Betaproteobacteria bacterium]|nr:SRPBCC family protein [Betaproteobacteria bacterium]
MNDRATLIQPSTVRFERLLPGPVERVWAYLTESKKRALWLAAGEFDLRVGGRIELLFDNPKLTGETPPAGARGAVPHRAEGTITRLEPMKLLAHTWAWEGGKSEVTYELAPRGKEVLLTIHHKLPDDPGLKIAVGGGWATHVGILEDRLNGAQPRPFFSTHAREMKELEKSLAEARV